MAEEETNAKSKKAQVEAWAIFQKELDEATKETVNFWFEKYGKQEGLTEPPEMTFAADIKKDTGKEKDTD